MTDRLVVLDTKNASHSAFAAYHTGTRTIYSDYSDFDDPNSQVHTSNSSQSHHAISRSSHVLHQLTTNGTNPLCLQPDTTVCKTIHHCHTPRPNNPTSSNTTPTVTHPYPTAPHHPTPPPLSHTSTQQSSPHPPYLCATTIYPSPRPHTRIWFNQTRITSRRPRQFRYTIPIVLP